MQRLLDALCDIALSPAALAVFLILVSLFVFATRVVIVLLRHIGLPGWILLKASFRGAIIAVLGIALAATLVRIGQNSVLLRQLERAIR